MDDPWNQNPPENDGLEPAEAGQRQPGPEPPGLQPQDGDNEADNAAEMRGPRILNRLEILLIVIVLWLVSSSLAMAFRPFTNGCWGTSLPKPNAQGRIWGKLGMAHGSRASPMSWNEIDSSPDALESLSYDSLKDRVLRYVKSTRNGRAFQPTVMMATYVRQQAEEETSVPSSSISKYFGDRVCEVLEPKVTAGTSSFSEWLSGEVELFKPDNTPPASRDKSHQRKPSEVADLATYTIKVVEEIKIIEVTISKALSEPEVKSKIHMPFSAKDLETYAENVADKINSLGDNLLKTQAASHTRKTAEKLISKADIDGYKSMLVGTIKSLGERLIENSGASPSLLAETKTSASEMAPEVTTTRRKGGYEKWWSEFRLSGPPTISPTQRKPVKTKPQTHTESTEVPNSAAATKSMPAQKKGSYELWWSEYRLQGPPTMVSSSSSTVVSSPFAPKAETTRPVKKTTEDRQILLYEESSLSRNEESTTSAKKPKTKGSGKSKSGATELNFIETFKQGGRRPQHPDEDSFPSRNEAEHSPPSVQKRALDNLKTTVTEVHTVDVVINTPSDKISQTEQKAASKVVETAKVAPRSPRRKVSDKSKSKSKSKPTVATVHSVDVPVHHSSDKIMPTEEKSDQQGATTAKASPLWPWEETSDKPKSKSTLAEFHYANIFPHTRLEDIQPIKQIPKYTKVITISRASRSKKKKRDKWRNGVFTVTEIHYVDVPVYPTSGLFTPTAETLKNTDEGSKSREPTKTNAAGVLVDSIIEALNGFYFLSPLEPNGQTWKAWAASFLDFSSLKERFANFKNWVSSLPSTLIRRVGIVNKHIGEAKSWWSKLVHFTRTERDRVRKAAPEEKIFDDRFFNSPSYQHRSSKNKTAEVILDISGTLYSVIDQLMAEGNQHFANRTHLQAAWNGLFRAESVMGSSRTVKTMAKDSENRNLLTTYVGVVHKFGRLVTDVSEAADRIAESPIVTEADVTHWKSVKGGFNKFLREVKKRPPFVNRELMVSEGFHRDILIDGRDKLDSARSALEKLTTSSPI
ncbi:hypothetical protein ACEPPN_013050 [Leptodophora sp. 'Broadleaf-Isolate-01']